MLDANNGVLMKRTRETSALPVDDTMDTEMSAVSFPDPAFGVVIQDNFSSDKDRTEFMQTITSHGITFLRCANTPLPDPSEEDLNLLGRLAKVLIGLWSNDNKRGRNHDA